MTTIPNTVWFSGIPAVTAGISAVTLSIQRGLYHKSQQQQEEGRISLSNQTQIKNDEKRDLSVPFADTNRITRITYCTLLLTTLAAIDLYSHVIQANDKPHSFYSIVTYTSIFITWLYASVLALTSGRYRLPNTWGWILNVHLFIIYSVAWLFSIYRFWEAVIIESPQMAWMQCLFFLLPVLLGFDLVYVTGTVKKGPPFLDEKDRQVCNVNVDSILGRLYFSWVTNVVRSVSAKKGDFTDNDLPSLTPEYRAHNIFYTFGNTRGDGSLLYRLCKANTVALIAQVGLSVFASGLYYAPAFFMNRLLQLLQDLSEGIEYEHPLKYGSLIVIGMGVVIVILGVVVGQLWYYASCVLNPRVRIMLNVEVYRKSLRRRDLSVASTEADENSEQNNQEDASDGAAVNLIGTDATRVADFAGMWFTCISAPLELVIGFYFLYNLIGVSCFFGLLVMVLILPINHYNAKIFSKTQDRLMEARDKRVSLMTEMLLGIRQIKFFAWESKWEERIMKARNVELQQLKITYINGVFFSLVWQGAPIFVTLASFYMFTKVLGNELNAPIAFTVIGIFGELRYALNVIPELVIDGIQAYSSLKRIQKFLEEDEIESISENYSQNEIDISFRKATIGWKKATKEQADEETSFILKDIDAQFPNNELSLISGSTGSGKTLMLLGLLGEAILIDGEVSCPRVPLAETIFSEFEPISKDIDLNDWILDRSLAYVSQTPWLQNASIRSNILFGLPYIESRYRETLYVCALDKDLSVFEDGDRTEIGEKGITLSGGQKARVALARAVYSRAKNVLMDDVLSAVDAHTAKHLYEKCLMGPLMKNRTRILVTHHIKLCIKGCGLLVHIDGGRAGIVGSPDELRRSGQLQKIIEDDNEFETEQDATEEEAIESTATALSNSSNIVAEVQKDKKDARVLVEDELRASGSVKFRLYKIYFSMAGSKVFWLILATLVVSARLFEIGESWWVKIWAQSYEQYPDESNVNSTISPLATGLSVRTHSFGPMTVLDSQNFSINDTYTTPSDGVTHLNYYLGIYCLITCSNVIIGCLRYASMYWGAIRANRQLYANLLHRVFRAPLRFFDTTPMGRILNRFSKDFESVDSKIPTDLMAFIIQWFTIITTAITVCVVLPIFFFPMIIIVIINIVVGVDYISSSRELKRLDSVTRSPIFSNFTETISGVATIRAFGASQQFLQTMMNTIDTNVRPLLFSLVVNRWVSMRYGLTSAAINFSACAITLYNKDNIDVSLAGFGLSFVLLFTDNMFWGIRQYTGLEMSFNAIERIVEFMEMEQEAEAISSIRPPPQWPIHGEIQVKDLEVRYAAELDPVLKGISFSVKPQEKIGVVGRTGSGKSTLALSFFRFVEASKGSIVIDNIDIKDLGTEDLRSNLTIIPQDPTLFSGTLRSNMDPFDQFQDGDIFAALRRVHLIPSTDASIDSLQGEVNTNVFKDLDTVVNEGGKNFSQGQRQLLCLARALLKSSRIVLMDEATASVDFETDKAIQKTIATEFSNSTILCIAHRLHTVIEYDRILLLDHGEILEFDSPLTLINNPESSFYKMCRNSGEFDSLLELAKSKHALIDI